MVVILQKEFGEDEALSYQIVGLLLHIGVGRGLHKEIAMFVEEESMSSPKDIGDGQAVDKQIIENRLDNNAVKAPEVGMHFDSLDSLFEYYKLFGKQEGFRVKKKTSRLSIDGKLKFVSLSCSRAGKSQSNKQNFLISNASKMECKARVNATIFEDGKCKINSVVLEHNHGLGSQKPGPDLCNKEISIDAQKNVELNDRGGTTVMKNCQTVVVEAGSRDNVPFLEKDYRNFIERAKRLRLGVGDAEAIHEYFEEFEENWRQFVNDLNLHDNLWLSGLYEERHQWVPAFVKDTFWAGMSTIQRSECMNLVFDGYVNFKTTLKQFIEQYDNALRNKIEKENREDFYSFSKCIPCVTLFEIEKQFQAVYTNAKFKEFQKELMGKLYCEVSYVDEKEGIFDVSEIVFVGERRKDVHFNVHFNKENCEVKCSCCLFEFRGILCKHIISVFMKFQIINVPAKYVLPRWRKDLRRCYTRVRVGYDDFNYTPEAQRRHKLQQKFEEVADWAVVSNDNFSMLWNWIDEFQSRVKKQFMGAVNTQSTSENS
ncbi:hypothetical protein FEM48_Zijuj01G0182400 [Ziziphus jujuba var. spinosa]|uniref:Protein FAR1-RELATED SEQUENCE n=1 Tax=Ziziphus jujuba var. spinosa TaxID=714518 RepID=A0A978W2T6_ZIZJJ|nr:hypothetical protein FEM48_Zijuj01G0182400 [Ziziphus jujuba var. spinosa]